MEQSEREILTRVVQAAIAADFDVMGLADQLNWSFDRREYDAVNGDLSYDKAENIIGALKGVLTNTGYSPAK